MPALSPTPTDNAIGKRVGDFATLTNALDYAAAGVGGMNFYTARGVLADVIGWAQMREDALVVAGRLLARGLQPGDRVAIVAETEAETEAEGKDQAIGACPTGSLLVKRVGYAVPVGKRKFDHQRIGSEIESSAHEE